MDNTTILSTEKQLQFIEASYHTVPDLNPENPCSILDLMTQRFNDSKHSFLLLYAHHCTFDAMLVAGYMMELLAQMTKIRENKIEREELYGRAAYKQIQLMLSYTEKENETQWKNSFQQWMIQLEQYASNVFKNKDDILSILKNNSLTSQEKLEQLHKQEEEDDDMFLHPTKIQKDMNYFMKHAKKVLKSHKMPIHNLKTTLGVVYQLYCCYKHSNPWSFIPPSIDLAAFVVILSIVEYCDCGMDLLQLLQCYEVLS